MLGLYDFSIDYVRAPLVVRTDSLRFGWKLRSDRTGVMQDRYRIEIEREGEVVADSGTVSDSRVCDRMIPSLTLSPMCEYTARITVWDNHGDTATLTHAFSTAPAEEQWADAKWIKPAVHTVGWAPFLRTKFKTAGVKRAVLVAAGLGCAAYYMNGKQVDEGYYVDPPASNYEKTVYYRCFDVTDLVKDGGNAIAVLLGEGFYAQSRVWTSGGKYGMAYGPECVKLKLFLYLNNGDIQTVCTDTTHWQYRYSHITVNNLYAGEHHDMRLAVDDFSLYEGVEDGWCAVAEDDTEKGTLTLAPIPPVREIRRLPAKAVHTASGVHEGVFIFDIGENMAGIAEIHLPRAPRGAVCTIRYAEALTPHGTLDQRSTGSATLRCIQQDVYICRGDENGETFRPQLCYHGFRYVEITGLYQPKTGNGELPPLDTVVGIQLSTDMKKITDFSVSYPYLQGFYDLMQNTYRSNFHGFPEDCPVRERCGWLGDAQLVCDFGLLQYDAVACYEKYLEDIRTTREVYGTWQQIAPGKRTCGDGTPLWECAQIMIPYCLYKYCGDSSAVYRHAEAMKQLIERELGKADGYIISAGLGDWIPAVRNSSPRRMPVAHSSTLVFYEMCVIMEELCEALGIGDPKTYRLLAAEIKTAFNARFYDRAAHSYGYWGSDGAALQIGIHPDGEKDALTKSLVARIRADDYQMSTGIYGNKYLTPALLDAGYGDEAFKFLFNPDFVSFGQMLDQGATTIWEAPYMHEVETDREFWVSSYNHPMHGGFLYTCMTHIAGIRPQKAGFERFVFKPCFTKNTDRVDMTMDTVYGVIAVSIRKTDEGYTASLTVPAGTTCVLDSGETLGSGVHTLVFPV